MSEKDDYWFDLGYEKGKASRDAEVAELSRQLAAMTAAVGLASTIKGNMEIDVNDPVGMMQQTVAHFRQRDVERDQLCNELEIERMRNVACGVVAMADTPDSAKQARDMHSDYMSASCSDVARRVDECIKLREQMKLLRDALEKILSQEADNGCILSAGNCAELAYEALAATEPKP